ncbi:glycosyltransferase [Eubacterium aggregans]|uniref:glycosyltransferase n=1 Tax=Eubacterium aggregans TaxID=81409 RepID=UPI003F401EE5
MIKYLNTRKKPDVIYCAIPSLDVGKAAADYCQKNGVKFIIDIQDLWPKAFKMVFNIPIISNIIYYPIEKKANSIYKAADVICAVSETYVNRTLEVNTKSIESHSDFLGTRLDQFDENKRKTPIVTKHEDELWLIYLGTLGHSYDITIVLDALNRIEDKINETNIRFLVIGEGQLRKQFEEYSKELGLNVYFTGWVSYDNLASLLCQCDIAVNPIMRGAAQSIINKVGDYAAAGLPVINTQECQEYRKLIDRYNAGINCENSSVNSVKNAIETLVMNEKLRKSIGKGNRRMAEERFDRRYTYQELINVIEKIWIQSNNGEFKWLSYILRILATI